MAHGKNRKIPNMIYAPVVAVEVLEGDAYTGVRGTTTHRLKITLYFQQVGISDAPPPLETRFPAGTLRSVNIVGILYLCPYHVQNIVSFRK